MSDRGISKPGARGPGAVEFLRSAVWFCAPSHIPLFFLVIVKNKINIVNNVWWLNVYACYTVKIYKNKPQINFKQGGARPTRRSWIRLWIFHVEMVSKYIWRYTKSCVWISVETNICFLCYIRKPGFQFQTSRPGPGFTTHFTNTPKRSFRKIIIIKKKVLHIILFVRHHGLHKLPYKTLEVQDIIFERSSSS